MKERGALTLLTLYNMMLIRLAHYITHIAASNSVIDDIMISTFNNILLLLHSNLMKTLASLTVILIRCNYNAVSGIIFVATL